MFKHATRTQSKLRMALCGPSGSGKTYSALAIAHGLGKKIALIDSEAGSASKYAGENGFNFDVCELESFSPESYTKAIQAAGDSGYDVLIIDSLSHAWMGTDGALALVDNAAKRSQSGNKYTAWRDVTPLHNGMVDAILHSKCHVLATLRVKTEYVIEQNDKGKSIPRKIGLAPVQRDGIEHEFDAVGDLTLEHDCIIAKTRCSALDGKVFHKPGKQLSDILLAWLSDGSSQQVTVTTSGAPSSALSRDRTLWDDLKDTAEKCGLPKAYITRALMAYCKDMWGKSDPPIVFDRTTGNITGLLADRFGLINQAIVRVAQTLETVDVITQEIVTQTFKELHCEPRES